MGPADNVSLLTDRNLEAGRGDDVAIVTDGPWGVGSDVGSHDAQLTFADVHRLSCRFAVHLRELGVHRGERVLLVLDDTPVFHAAFLGTIRAGAVPIAANFLARADDFGYFLADSYAVLAVVDDAFLAKVGPEADRLGVPVLVANGDGDGELTARRWLSEGDDHIDPVDTHRDDAAFWLYSSGSTGRPKGVVHMQHAVACTCENFAFEVLGLRAGDIGLSTTKLFHAYGLGNGLTFPLWVGATAVQLRGAPTPDKALDRVERHRPTVLFSVPALFHAMLGDTRLAERDLTSLRLNTSAAEALPPDVWRRWHERTGTEIVDGIGSTEMLHIYCSNRPGEIVPGSSGTPVPGYELEIRDTETGRTVTDAEAEGDLYVKGLSALAYYWHRYDKSVTAIDGAWFFSGDRYRRDADGVYWYEGRADDMMKVKGLWVSPIEIENRLMEHDAVSEAAVVGVKRDGLTAIKAYVIPAGTAAADHDLVVDLQGWCKDGLQRYQYPHEVEFVADFPRTATGKIQRFELRDLDAGRAGATSSSQDAVPA